MSLIRCTGCGKERPESEMKQATIVQQKYDFGRKKKYIAKDRMWFCGDTACADHYQMGCEG